MIRTVGGQELKSFPPELVGTSACPVCGSVGIPVTRLVMRAVLPRDLQAHLAREGFSFCPTPSCPLAYFDNKPSAYVHKDELRVTVGRKSAGPTAVVCYCLRVTEGRVVEEIAVKRCCRTVDEVADATGALLGKACHIMNPSGQCCGAEVKATIVKGLQLAGFADDSLEVRAVIAENVDHCRSRRGLGQVPSAEAQRS